VFALILLATPKWPILCQVGR